LAIGCDHSVCLLPGIQQLGLFRNGTEVCFERVHLNEQHDELGRWASGPHG
jgi:hypothetical protein